MDAFKIKCIPILPLLNPFKFELALKKKLVNSWNQEKRNKKKVINWNSVGN